MNATLPVSVTPPANRPPPANPPPSANASSSANAAPPDGANGGGAQDFAGALSAASGKAARKAEPAKTPDSRSGGEALPGSGSVLAARDAGLLVGPTSGRRRLRRRLRRSLRLRRIPADTTIPRLRVPAAAPSLQASEARGAAMSRALPPLADPAAAAGAPGICRAQRPDAAHRSARGPTRSRREPQAPQRLPRRRPR